MFQRVTLTRLIVVGGTVGSGHELLVDTAYRCLKAKSSLSRAFRLGFFHRRPREATNLGIDLEAVVQAMRQPPDWLSSGLYTKILEEL